MSPPQARDTHPCDGVEGGLGLALPATALAEGCAEGCRDTGGEVQVQLQPPDAHRDVPGGLCGERGGACGTPKCMRGARDPAAGLWSAQGCPPPVGLTWPVGTLHVAAVPVGELGRRGISGGARSTAITHRCPPAPSQAVPTHPWGLTRKQSWGCTSTLSSVYAWNGHRARHRPRTTQPTGTPVGPWGPVGAPTGGTAPHHSRLAPCGTLRPGPFTCSSSLAVELGTSWQGAVSAAASLQHRVARGCRGQLALSTIAIWSLLLAL